MKNLVVLFAVLFLFSLTSCSDVNDNSFLTNPVMEKTSLTSSESLPSPIYPYTYLFNFTNVEELKYQYLEGENAVEFFIPENGKKFVQLFVVVNFNHDISQKMFFIDQIENESFKVFGIDLNQVQNISVYGIATDNVATESVSPFTNNSVINEVFVNSWKVDNSSVVVDCGGIWPSSLKYLFAEIRTKDNNFLVFLQRPWSTKFVIPEYGKYGVESIRLFGYQTLMEATVTQK